MVARGGCASPCGQPPPPSLSLGEKLWPDPTTFSLAPAAAAAAKALSTSASVVADTNAAGVHETCRSHDHQVGAAGLLLLALRPATAAAAAAAATASSNAAPPAASCHRGRRRAAAHTDDGGRPMGGSSSGALVPSFSYAAPTEPRSTSIQTNPLHNTSPLSGYEVNTTLLRPS